MYLQDALCGYPDLMGCPWALKFGGPHSTNGLDTVLGSNIQVSSLTKNVFILCFL